MLVAAILHPLRLLGRAKAQLVPPQAPGAALGAALCGCYLRQSLVLPAVAHCVRAAQGIPGVATESQKPRWQRTPVVRALRCARVTYSTPHQAQPPCKGDGSIRKNPCENELIWCRVARLRPRACSVERSFTSKLRDCSRPQDGRPLLRRRNRRVGCALRALRPEGHSPLDFGAMGAHEDVVLITRHHHGVVFHDLHQAHFCTARNATHNIHPYTNDIEGRECRAVKRRKMD